MNKESQTIDKETIIDRNQIIKYLDTFGLTGKLQQDEKERFVEIAKAYQLNPFKREIYCVPYLSKKTGKRTLSIITGYEVYLKRAERIHALDGWSIETYGSVTKRDLKAVITIHRKDWSKPFIHEVWWLEYSQDNDMWRSKPVTMIKKVAIAQAFRMAFPDELGGMPYTSDEMPDMEQEEKRAQLEENPVKQKALAKKTEKHKYTDEEIYRKCQDGTVALREKDYIDKATFDKDMKELETIKDNYDMMETFHKSNVTQYNEGKKKQAKTAVEQEINNEFGKVIHKEVKDLQKDIF